MGGFCCFNDSYSEQCEKISLANIIRMGCKICIFIVLEIVMRQHRNVLGGNGIVQQFVQCNWKHCIFIFFLYCFCIMTRGGIYGEKENLL